MTAVTLIYPPATAPRAPHLPLPALAGFLRANGVETQLFDLDLEGLLAMLRPASLREAARRLRQAPPATLQTRLWHVAERLPECIDAALGAFRSRARFLDPNDRLDAYQHLLDGLDLVSAAAPRPITYSIDPIGYEVAGVDSAKFGDLVAVTADPAANLFRDFWIDEIVPQIERLAPAVVGISITARRQSVPALMLARLLRERGHFVVLGGPFIARFAETLAALPEFFDYFADGVVPYEGESALLELLSQLDGARDFARVPNYIYCVDGRVRCTAPHLEDLAQLPTPDFDGLPLDRYLTPEPVLPFFFGKGCYYGRCKFCESSYINRIATVRYRLRPIARVFDDVMRLATRHGARHFIVADEAAPPRLLEQLAGLLLAAGRDDLAFEAYARLERGFTAPLLGKLARAGVKRFFFGLESFDQPTLDHMKKGTRLEDVEPLLDRCDAADIRYLVFGLAGLPEQSRESIERTLEFARGARFHRPGNGFELQPMQIHLRSPYGQDLDALAVSFDRALLEPEFVHGLGVAWSSTRGASRTEVSGLIEDFFAAPAAGGAARALPFLWPLVEEWGVYYAAAYANTPFPYVLDLREPAPRSRDTVGLGGAVVTWPAGGAVHLETRSGAVDVAAASYEQMRALSGRPLGDWVAALGGVSPALEETLFALLRARILQLHPAPE